VCIWQPAFFLGKRIRFEGSLISQNHGLWRRAIFVFFDIEQSRADPSLGIGA
jgi:hypothetical protein